MEGFNYKIKIENSPFEIEKSIKTKSMKLSSIPKVVDFNISFKDDSTCQELFDLMNNSLIEKDTIFNEVKLRVLTKPYPYKSKKKRLVKKWWNKYSEIKVYKNVKLEMKNKG